MAVFMTEALKAIQEVLDNQGLNYQFDEDKNVFSLSFSLKKTKLRSVQILMRVVASKKNPDECLRINSHAFVGITADEESMNEVAEFLHRANYGLIFGCFELDYDDGDIRYRMACNCVDSLPGYDALEDLLYLPISMVERYGNGLLAVSMGVLSAEEAIKRIEGE